MLITDDFIHNTVLIATNFLVIKLQFGFIYLKKLLNSMLCHLWLERVHDLSGYVFLF